MRIAITTDQYLPMVSGLVDSIVTLAEELRRQGHEVRVYAPRPARVQPDKNVFYFSSFALPGSGGAIMFNFPFGAMRDLRAFKPDVIHTHLFGMAGFLAWRASRQLRVPFVGTDHTSPADYLHYAYINFEPFIFLVRRFASWFYGRCTVVSAPSQHILEELYNYGLHTNHSEVISNPITFKQFRPLTNKDELKKKFGVSNRAILLFGRIAAEKNLDFAIDIFADLVTQTDAQLLIVGDGPYRTQLEEKIKAIGVQDKTKFLGVLRGEELTEAINAADVYLITSTSEIQSMTVLQAMACGLPVVGARAGGIPECVIEGDTGFTIEPKNKKEFIEKISLLLSDQLLRENFGKAAQKAVETYSPEQIALKFLNLYQKAKALYV